LNCAVLRSETLKASAYRIIVCQGNYYNVIRRMLHSIVFVLLFIALLSFVD